MTADIIRFSAISTKLVASIIEVNLANVLELVSGVADKMSTGKFTNRKKIHLHSWRDIREQYCAYSFFGDIKPVVSLVAFLTPLLSKRFRKLSMIT